MEGWDRLVRGLPNREGSMLFGRPIPVGDEGPETLGAAREVCTGELGRARFEGAGDMGRKVRAGEAGRASLDMLATEGLAGRPRPPIRELEAGEPGRATPAVKRAI
jgi:hypothetical protein